MRTRLGAAATRRVLAVGAYAVLTAVALGYIDAIPGVDRAITNAGTFGQVAIDAALLLTALGGVTCWIGGVLYALAKKRRGLAVVLGLCNFVGGFFYYFGHVLWQPPEAPTA